MDRESVDPSNPRFHTRRAWHRRPPSRVGSRKESVFAVVEGAVSIQLESRTRFELSPAMLRHGDDSERLRRAIKGMYLISSRIILGYLYHALL
jgi:hypothetical protein